MQVFASGRFGPFEVSGVSMDHHRDGVVPSDAVDVVVPTPVSREQATALLYEALEADDVAAYSPEQVRQLLTELVAGTGSAGVTAAERVVSQEQAANQFGREHWKACSRLAKQVTDGWARPPEAARGTFGPVELPEVRLEHHRLVGKHAAPGVPVAVPVSVSADQMAALLYDLPLDTESLESGSPSDVRRMVVEQIADGGSVGISEALHTVTVEREAGDPVAAAHWAACQRRARELVSDVTTRIRAAQEQQRRGPLSPPAPAGPAAEVPAQDRGERCRSAVEAAERAVAQLAEPGQAQYGEQRRAEAARDAYSSHPDTQDAGMEAAGVAR